MRNNHHVSSQDMAEASLLSDESLSNNKFNDAQNNSNATDSIDSARKPVELSVHINDNKETSAPPHSSTLAQGHSSLASHKREFYWATRLFEICVAGTALIVTLPLFLVVCLIIKSGTPGPILFRQKRLGFETETFKFLKFRTLYSDARERFPELYAYKYDTEQLEKLHFKVTNDPRVTPQGRWLRKSTLDEIPNFWCVLTGEMALVGPRPEIPEMLPYYHGEMLEKFSVRPGITGLAQVSGRGNLSFFDTVEYDIDYVRNKSFLLDLKIIAKTVKKLFVREGAF